MRSPLTTSTRLRTVFHLAVAVTTVASLLAVTPGTTAAASLLEPEGGTYEATIMRTEYGIPHIEAQDYGSLGFGQGYGAAEDIICSLADTMVTVRGERSKYFGPDETYDDQVAMAGTNLQTDALFTDIINREVVEDLLASEDPGVAPGDEVRAMVRGYVTGINQYLEDVGGADGIDDPACSGAEWVQPATEMDLWRGIHAALLIASTGFFLPEIVDADPPSVENSGVPVSGSEPQFTPVPEQLPTTEQLEEGLGRGEGGFGSNATALDGDTTATGRGMLLGNPHFPWQGRYRFTQTQLTIPGEYDVRGGMLHGSPVVNIGWNEDVAWSHTVSTAYRFTPYEYMLVPGMPTMYVTEDGTKELEHREVTIELPDGSTVTEDLYRTDEGYVVDDEDIQGGPTSGLLRWSEHSVWTIRDANAEHLKVLDVFHEMAKAGSVEELHAAHAATGGMPWVNTIAADKDGNVLYADESVVPHVTDDQVEQCATLVGQILFDQAGLPGLNGTFAQGACAWGSDEDAARDGIFGEANLPDTLTLPDGAEDPSWVVNANDSYWLPNPATPLTGYARIIGCEECERSLRTRMVYRYVMDRLDGSDELGGDDVFTHDQLMEIETVNRVFAAELARQGDNLQTICSTSGVDAAACTALAEWDGMTNIDSRGAHLFREFWEGTNGDTRWVVPFDASDPVGTPNTLNPADPQNQQAMNDAVTFLDDEGVAYDALLGDVQKAGDDGAGDISVHGGFGSTGNANAIRVSDPTANEDVLYPISYGSSHIQAVAFTDEGVDGCTILTYGQAYDTTSDHHDDQTELWEGEEWVCWPADVQAAALTTKTVTGQVPGSDGAPAGDDDQLASTGGGSAAVLGGVLLAGAVLLLRRRRDDA